jgi:hypothetical protein
MSFEAVALQKGLCSGPFAVTTLSVIGLLGGRSALLSLQQLYPAPVPADQRLLGSFSNGLAKHGPGPRAVRLVQQRSLLAASKAGGHSASKQTFVTAARQRTALLKSADLH